MKKYIINWGPPFLFLACIILIWQLSVDVFKIPLFILPSPKNIFSVFLNKWNLLFSDLGITMLESILGFMVGNLFGIGMAVLFVHSKFSERSVFPFMIALKAIPLVALAPLLILWFGYGLVGKIVMAALICFFPAIVNTTVGLKAVDPEAMDLMRALFATKKQILFKLRFPSALPYIFSALKISSTLSVVGAIVAELSGAQQGIGYTILQASYQIDTPLLFSAIIMASIGGILFFGLIALAEKKVLYWHEGLVG